MDNTRVQYVFMKLNIQILYMNEIELEISREETPFMGKFSFLNDQTKMELLERANQQLNITPSKRNKIIFIYSKPKVGSTSLVSSIRLFGCDVYNVIHIHIMFWSYSYNVNHIHIMLIIFT